jgi:hypothetical protein
MRAGCVVLLILALLVVGLGAGAEIVARRTVDDRLTTEVRAALASQSRGGFASVTADEQGWALPDVARGRLSQVDVTALDGTVAGLPVQRLQLSATDLRFADLSAGRVTATATVDGAQALQTLADQFPGPLTGQIEVLGPDSVRLGATAAGQPATVDVRLRPDGTGGLVAEVVAAQVAGTTVDPAQVGLTGAGLIDGSELPVGLQVTSVTVRQSGGGAAVDVGMQCTAACGLQG